MANTALVGLSSQVALQRELDVVANNIANVNTNGFKADRMVFEQYLSPLARENRFPNGDQVVRFVQDRGTWHDFKEGGIQQTNNPLDVAIDGDNAFLVVQTPNGERYTRNGALKIDRQGRLVTSDGSAVLGDAGPITFQALDHSISITQDGRITALEGANKLNESLRGKLRLVSFDNPQKLQKDAGTKFALGGATARPATGARLVQGALEASNVSNVLELTRMIEITRAYTSAANVQQQQNDLRKSAIERLADVPT